MEREKISEVLDFIYKLAEYYRIELNESIAEDYVVVLSEHNLNKEVLRTLRLQCMKKLDSFPTAKTLIDMIQGKGQLTEKDRAVLLLEKLKEGIRTFGYTQFQIAKKTLDPEVWALGQKFGSWSRVCQKDFDDPAINAQARDFAIAILREEVSIETTLQLESANKKNKVNQLIGNLSAQKQLGEKNG